MPYFTSKLRSTPHITIPTSDTIRAFLLSILHAMATMHRFNATRQVYIKAVFTSNLSVINLSKRTASKETSLLGSVPIKRKDSKKPSGKAIVHRLLKILQMVQGCLKKTNKVLGVESNSIECRLQTWIKLRALRDSKVWKNTETNTPSTLQKRTKGSAVRRHPSTRLPSSNQRQNWTSVASCLPSYKALSPG